MLLEDPFIRDKWEQKQIMKDVIDMQNELVRAAEEGTKVKRFWCQFCERCREHFKKNEMFELHFCPECVQETDSINGMGNAAIPLQCVTCRREF
jgi:hypothetical protein